MTQQRTSKARKARELARRALGSPADAYDDFDGLLPRRTVPIVPPSMRWEPMGKHGEPCLTLGQAARALGISGGQLAMMVAPGELVTVPIGDFGGRMVSVAELERVKAARGG